MELEAFKIYYDHVLFQTFIEGTFSIRYIILFYDLTFRFFWH